MILYGFRGQFAFRRRSRLECLRDDGQAIHQVGYRPRRSVQRSHQRAGFARHDPPTGGGCFVSLTVQSFRLDNERVYLFTVLDSVSAGIIAFSDSFELLSINRAAVQMLQIEAPAPRARLTDVLVGDLTPLFDTIRELTRRSSRSREVTLIRGGELLYLEVSAARLSGGS